MRRKLSFIILFYAFVSTSLSQETVVLKAMKSEINRTMSGMASEKNPPYFLSYSITETKSIVLSASFGKIEASTNTKNRILDIDLRVGNYKTDNSHTIRGSRFEFGGRGRSIEIPFSEDEQSLRQILWQATDQHFKKAVEKYGKVLTNMAVKVKDEDTSADFSRQSAEKYI